MSAKEKAKTVGISLIRVRDTDAKKLKAAAKFRRRSVSQYLIDLGLSDFEKLSKSGKISLTQC